MAKRHLIDLPDAADGVILDVVLWHDSKGRTQLFVHHQSQRVPFPVAREALVNALAALEPDQDPRFKAADSRAVEATRGFEHLDERDLPKGKPS